MKTEREVRAFEPHVTSQTVIQNLILLAGGIRFGFVGLAPTCHLSMTVVLDSGTRFSIKKIFSGFR